MSVVAKLKSVDWARIGIDKVGISILGMAILACYYASPFGMERFMSGPDLFFHWVFLCSISYFSGEPIVRNVYHVVSPYRHQILTMILISILAATIVSGSMLVYFWIRELLGGFTHSQSSMIVKGAFPTAFSIGILRLLSERREFIRSMQSAALIDTPTEEIELSVLKWLPEKFGKNIIAVKSNDHYCDIITDKGCHTELRRFKDILKELEAEDGLRVHRSYWISKRNVESVERSGNRTTLKMSNGDEVPVSLTYRKETLEYLEGSEE